MRKLLIGLWFLWFSAFLYLTLHILNCAGLLGNFSIKTWFFIRETHTLININTIFDGMMILFFIALALTLRHVGTLIELQKLD
jgi:hypothetical protein